MKRIGLITCALATIFSLPLFAMKPGDLANTGFRSGSVKMQAMPFSATEVVLKSSWIKNRELLMTEFLHRLDPDRLLHNFRINAGLSSKAMPLEGWESPGCGLRGHFVGHYLSACASVIASDGDSLLSKRISYMIGALGDCQQKLGGKYLSAFPETEFATLEKKYGGVWAPYYTFHKIMQGLLDVYTFTGNRQAFQILLNMADYVEQRMSRLPATEIEKILFSAEANPTNEAGGMNEVLHNLYAITKEEKHLVLAEIFDRKWFYQPLSEGTDILSGLHANTHIALVNGYARRYMNTGEENFRQAVLNFWDMLLKHHAYVNGSSSGPRPVATTTTSRVAEHWGHSDHLSATLTGHNAESCVTHNTQRITATLFGWTANPAYAEAYMNTFYNAVMALQNAEDGKTVYHLALGSPCKKDFLKENDFRCCNGTGVEAFSRLNSGIYFHDRENLWVNLFIPSRLTWQDKKIILEQTGNFPEDPHITFVVKAGNPARFTLQLFIPSWANGNTNVLINGEPFRDEIKPLSFAKINRTWKDGDKVELRFEYHFTLKTMPDNENVMALLYGPTLLAFESDKEVILKGNHKTILQNLKKDEGRFSFSLDNGSTSFRLSPFYNVTNQSYGVYATIRNEF